MSIILETRVAHSACQARLVHSTRPDVTDPLAGAVSLRCTGPDAEDRTYGWWLNGYLLLLKTGGEAWYSSVRISRERGLIPSGQKWASDGRGPDARPDVERLVMCDRRPSMVAGCSRGCML